LRRAGLVRGALRPRPILEAAATNFPAIIAEYEAELVHRACQAEGFDAALTEKVLAWHAGHSDQLDYAEGRRDGVGYYVRCLGELVSRPPELSRPLPPGPWLEADRQGPRPRDRVPKRAAPCSLGTSVKGN
jgi:hypothetical protein